MSRPLNAAWSRGTIEYRNGRQTDDDGEDVDDGKPKTVRLVTRMHLPTVRRRAANYRAVAELMDGHRRLLCVGVSPRDVRDHARRLPRADLPPNTVAILVQRWSSSDGQVGRWEDVG